MMDKIIMLGGGGGCGGCLYWGGLPPDLPSVPDPAPFSLPCPIPQWPKGSGQGFGSGRVSLGEVEVIQITKFEFIFSCDLLRNGKNVVNFYKPAGVPDGYFSLGHYCQSNEKPLRGVVLVARDIAKSNPPALLEPLDYSLVWTPNDGIEDNLSVYDGYFWLPQAPEGYKALGFVVTNKPNKPDLGEVRCVRADLTDRCEAYRSVLVTSSKFSLFGVWNTRPRHRGMHGEGVSTGTFFCCSDWTCPREEFDIACLRNLEPDMHAMPSIDQIHSLIRHYGPTVFFHPDEVYLPSSVPWFFENGALLYRNGVSLGESIDVQGSNLPSGGKNDGEYWIDLPRNDREKNVKYGDLESAKLYVHVKPALGGTFTDIAMWVFCPFNGPATLKIGFVNYALSRIGRHVGDWEHFTLRISNFTGELWSVYFSQHSGGEWVDVTDLEFIEGNKPIVYSSRNGHASYPHSGNYIQGSSKLGIGIRNDAARSDYFVDSSKDYEIIAAEYLGHGAVDEPRWLQYMREWGPTVVYDSRTELDRILGFLPVNLKYSFASVFAKLPVELYGEEGPTGPKEKNNWEGDERW